MTHDPDKPREWTLTLKSGGYGDGIATERGFTHEEIVQVIEKSYADQIAKELEVLHTENARLRGALEKIQTPNGQAGIDDAELFEQYFTHVEPQPMGTPKTIFRLGHAQGMAGLANIARKALAGEGEGE